MTPQAQLSERPGLERSRATYVNQLLQVRQKLEVLAPEVEWDSTPPGSLGDNGCFEPFDDVPGASSLRLVTGGAGAIPDSKWKEVVETSERLLMGEGYGEVKILVNRPMQHALVFTDEYDTKLTISGERNTILDVTSGCFLNGGK